MFIYYIKVVKTITFLFCLFGFFSFIQVEKEFETRGEYPPVPSIMFFYTDFVNKTIYTLTNIVLFPLEMNVIHKFDYRFLAKHKCTYASIIAKVLETIYFVFQEYFIMLDARNKKKLT